MCVCVCMCVYRSRSLGSAALNCCMVATGSADAYYEYGLHCWDIAAAHLIVKEAGGVCMYPTGKQLEILGETFRLFEAIWMVRFSSTEHSTVAYVEAMMGGS